MKTYLFLAEGFEEIEAITPIDLCRRAGIDLLTVSIHAERQVVGSHGIPVQADLVLAELEQELRLSKANVHDFAISRATTKLQALIFPGGMPGAKNLASCELLCHLIRLGNLADILIAAICAAPAVLLGSEGAGILQKRKFTCYPGFEARALEGQHCNDRVVHDENLITAVSAGAAAEFSLSIIANLLGDKVAEKVRDSTLYRS